MSQPQTPTPTHTPGKWAWYGNTSCKNIYLATTTGGRRFVMDFARWGMASAQPRFQVRTRSGDHESGVMVPASEFVTFEVGDRGVIGAKAAKSNDSVYRYDINGILHPDAWLIAAAPELLAMCKELANARTGDGLLDPASDLFTRAEVVIAKAEGRLVTTGDAGAA